MNKNDIIKKMSAFSIGPIVGALINFITTPVITYFISPDEYGRANMFTVAQTIILLAVIVGMDQAYAKRYYESNNRSGLFYNALFIPLLLLATFEIGCAFLTRRIGLWLFGSTDEILCVYALMVTMPCLIVERFLMLSIRMAQRGKVYSGMTILSKALILVVTILGFLTFEKSYRSVILGNTVAEVLCVTLLFIIQRHEVTVNIRQIDITEIKALLHFGLPLVPTTIIGWVLTGMDKVMIRSLSTYEQLGLYGVAAKVAAVLTIVQTCFTTVWVPMAYQWNSEGKSKNLFVVVGNLVSAVMSLAFAIILLGKDIIFAIFADGYQGAANIVPFLLFTPIMYTISEVTVMGIYFNEKTPWTVLVSAVSAAINLILNWSLIPKLGPVGAALATGISYIAFFWVRTLLSRRIWFKFPLRKYALMTVVLVTDALMSTFINNSIVYYSNIICIVLLMLLFKSELLKVINVGIDVLKSILEQKKSRG